MSPTPHWSAPTSPYPFGFHSYSESLANTGGGTKTIIRNLGDSAVVRMGILGGFKQRSEDVLNWYLSVPKKRPRGFGKDRGQGRWARRWLSVLASLSLAGISMIPCEVGT